MEERQMKFLKKKEENGQASSHIEAKTRCGITILDALAATGLRSIRYLKEIPNIEHVTINDIDAKATHAALENVKRNDVSEDLVTISNMDASLLMYQRRDPLLHYDVIDLDPYGTVGLLVCNLNRSVTREAWFILFQLIPCP